MTNAMSPALEQFLRSTSFTSISVLSLLAVAVLVIALIEQEVLRFIRPESRARDTRIFSIVIYPLSALAIMLIITRFVQLG